MLLLNRLGANVLGVLGLLVLACLAVTPVRAEPVRPLTIQQTRALSLGTVVSVSGVATTPSGVFESSFGDQGFAIQQRGAGIYVKTVENLGVETGRVVKVTGTLTDSFGLLTIVPRSSSDVSAGSSHRVPSPRPVRTADVGETTEGILVVAEGIVTRGPVNDMPYGTKLFIDDGSGELTIFVNMQTGISLSDFLVGQRVRITGFSSQFADHYEIDPRGPADADGARA